MMFVDVTNLDDYRKGWQDCKLCSIPMEGASESYNIGYAMAVGGLG